MLKEVHAYHVTPCLLTTAMRPTNPILPVTGTIPVVPHVGRAVGTFRPQTESPDFCSLSPHSSRPHHHSRPHHSSSYKLVKTLAVTLAMKRLIYRLRNLEHRVCDAPRATIICDAPSA